jgi:transmembrane sensor
MNASSPKAQINEQILEEACGWFMDCNEGELDEVAREHFHQWLRRSPEHVRALLEIASTWEESSGLAGSWTPDVTSLVAAAAAETNVIAFHSGATGPEISTTEHPRRDKRPWQSLTAVVATAVAASALFALGLSFTSRHNTFSTGIGEQRSIVLDDGSTVELDTRSQLRVHFSHAERLVELLDGQALFSVKQDTTRPFTVLSSGTHVRAVGTRFDVYQKGPTTAITVVEGRVTVTAPRSTIPATATPFLLSAGEQLTVSPNRESHLIQTDVTAATSWTQRRLIFDQAPLSEVVAELNRYNSREIRIDDPSLAAYHISGSFPANNPEQLLQFLRDRFEADVHEQGNDIRVSRK